MSIESALRKFLLNQPSIVALVEQRVWTIRLPQKPVYPAIVLTVLSAQSKATLTEAEDLETRRVQIDSWAATGDEGRAINDAVKKALFGYQGPMEGLYVQGIFALNEFARYDGDVDKVAYSADFGVWSRAGS